MVIFAMMKRLLSLSAALFLFAGLWAQTGPQLYNMGFDTWSKSGGIWYPCPKDTPAAKRVWDSPNPGTGKLGMNLATPEYEHVAVPGKGRAAARLESRKMAWAFVAGNLYNGHFVKTVELSGVETELGAPFKGRPRGLKGYYHYIPKKINNAKAPMAHMQGKMDEGIIDVILVDWNQPYRQITHKTGFIDPENDPHVIAHASIVIGKGTSGYVPFEIPFEYKNGKTPSYVLFTVSASRFGYCQTGAAGTVLYVDEFAFTY